MLLLTRRLNESFRIGDDVTVTVVSVKGNQIRVGIDAPRDIQVNREEWVARDRPHVHSAYRRACVG